MIKTPVKVLVPEGGFLPKYAHETDAGFDLPAYLPDGPVFIEPGEHKIITTGLKMSFDPGFEIQIRSRSGLAAKQGIFVLNSPGTIDCTYRGEFMIILHNSGVNTFKISHGDRIAQAVVQEVIQASFTQVDSLDETERGEGGLGHTGVAP